MTLRDAPTDIVHPIESLLGFHRRIERHLAALCRLPVHIEVNGLDVQVSATAASIVEFFSVALPLHHADEEHDLLPLLDQRILAGPEREQFRELRQRHRADHREMEETWRRVRRPLEAIGEGMHRRHPDALVQYFRAIHSVHISSEEAAMHVLAIRRLQPSDETVLARRMLARRAVTGSSRR
jgi:hypothetical protein